MAKLKILSISVAYLAVEFSLAILGWGGLTSFFSHPQFLALAILTVVLTAASFFSGASISTGVKEDRSNRWVIGALSLIGLFLAFFSAYTDRRGLLVFGGNTLRWVGVVLFTVGGVFAYGQRSCWAGDSAGWWPSRSTTHSSRMECTVEFATQAIWACW